MKCIKQYTCLLWLFPFPFHKFFVSFLIFFLLLRSVVLFVLRILTVKKHPKFKLQRLQKSEYGHLGR